MAIETAATPSPPPRRRRFLWRGLLFLALLAMLWFGHERALEWLVRRGLEELPARAGIKFDVGSMRLHLFAPVEFRDVRFRVTNPPASTTDATARRITIRLNGLWRGLFGTGRILRDAEIEGLAGTFDFRKPAIIPQPLPTLTRPEQEQLAATILRFLPEAARLRDCSAVFLADNQSYTVENLNAGFSEFVPGLMTVERVLIQAGSIRQEVLAGRAVTAWKDGALYLSDFRLRDEIVIRDFVANFANVGGVSLDWDVGAYGGTIRGGVVFGSLEDEFSIAASLAVLNVPFDRFPELLAIPARADGVIRDARLTFRGNPDKPLDNEISLRLSADHFRWNERGWESLVVGVNYIGRRLYLSNFELQQADNRISARGELTVPNDLGELPRARYNVDLSADVRDLTSLAALAGPAFGKVGGQLYLQGSVRGANGALDGYMNADGSNIRYETLPPASARIFLTAKNDELQVPYAAIWAGDDRLEAKGVAGLREPFRYAAEVTGAVKDLGIYAPFAGEAVAQHVFTGAATLEWQGDGSPRANSGSFHVRLTDVMTSATPTGLTGEFAATYSPENIYFKTVRLTHGPLELNSQLTLSASGLNIAGLTLQRGRLRLLTGEGFVPLNVFRLAEGRPFAEALAQDKPVYADFTSGELSVADLMEMAGQKANVRGRVRLNIGASGPLPALALNGQFTGRDLSAEVEDFAVPVTTADIGLRTEEGRLALDGAIRVKGFEPLTLTARMPFGYEELPDGNVRLFQDDAPLDAKLVFPGTSLEIFRPFLPGARRLLGTLAGRATVAGTLKAPLVNGEVTLVRGDIELAVDVPRITNLEGRARVDASRVTLESLRGAVGAGPFEATGWADLSDRGNPKLHARLKGTKVLLARDPGLRLRADLDLSADGQGGTGVVSGTVRLVDGRIFRRLEVTPFLVPSPVTQAAFAVPSFAGLVPPPWADWNVNVAIQNASPFLLVGNLATGEITPELTLRGTLGSPFADGVVTLTNLQAYLPASTILIPDGRIYFTEKYPFMPIMDVRARSDVSGYTVQMYAYGPLVEQNLALRSDPPLSQENLIFLLTTGLTPAGMSGAGLGEAAAGQGGIILLRSIARQLEPLGFNLNDVVNRLSVRVVPPKDPSESASLESDLRVNDAFSLTTGRDGYGFYNLGVRYTIRLK